MARGLCGSMHRRTYSMGLCARLDPSSASPPTLPRTACSAHQSLLKWGQQERRQYASETA